MMFVFFRKTELFSSLDVRKVQDCLHLFRIHGNKHLSPTLPGLLPLFLRSRCRLPCQGRGAHKARAGRGNPSDLGRARTMGFVHLGSNPLTANGCKWIDVSESSQKWPVSHCKPLPHLPPFPLNIRVFEHL